MTTTLAQTVAGRRRLGPRISAYVAPPTELFRAAMTATRRAFPRPVKVYRGARRRWPALEAAHASGKYVRETAELILAADDPDAILAFLQGVRDSRTAQASPAELEALVLEDIATDAEDVGASVPALLGRPEAVEAAIAATERDIAVDRRKLAVLWATLKTRRKA